MKKITLITFTLMVMFVSFSAYGKTVYVDGTNGNDSNDGLSWTNAKATIQAGIDAIGWNGNVLVKYGTYNITSPITWPVDNYVKIKFTSDDGTHTTYEDATKDSMQCIIDAGGSSSRVFYFDRVYVGGEYYCIVDGFTIKNASGYGIYCTNASPTIKNNIITENSGGGIYCRNNSHPDILNNIITENSGSGIWTNGHLDIINNVISDNTGSGIELENTGSTIINNTITGNSDGGIHCSGSPVVKNTILWGNSPQEIIATTITISYSDVQGGWEGEGNINADPLFGNPYSGLTYDLKPGSPCINAGTSSGAPSTDIVGRPRPSGSGVDIGAYEQNDEGTLAVTLSTFTASASSGSVTLKWRTETEVNNIGFGIYRSEEKDLNYTKISFVSGAGNSAMPIDYQFMDSNVEPGKTYFYYLEDIDIAGERSKSEIIKVVVPIAKPALPIPSNFALLQNYPNPFNPETWIPYQLAADSPVTISIYNAKGQLIRTITLGNKNAGVYITKDKAAYWDGTDSLGENVASGVYFYTLQAGEFRATQKMVIMK